MISTAARKKKTPRSIFMRIFLVLTALLLTQAIVFPMIFQFGGFFGELRNNALNTIVSTSRSRLMYLESEMLSYYHSITESYQDIQSRIDTVLLREHASYDDIAKDYQLNNLIIDEVAQKLVNQIKSSSVTGVYLILDGPAIRDVSADKAKAGLFITNSTRAITRISNEGLLLESGPSVLSKRLGIALSSYWSSAIHFDERADANSYDYFTKPIAAARALPKADRVNGMELRDYGYWCAGYTSPSKTSPDALYYSLPLLSTNGDVLGVIGVCINNAALLNYLNYRDLSDQGMGIYTLCLTNAEASLVPQFAFGPAYSHYFNSYTSIATTPSKWNDFYYFMPTRQVDTDLLGCINKLTLYNVNSPFYGEEWSLVSMVEESDIFIFVYRIQSILLIITLITAIIALAAAYLASRTVTKPILKLATDLKMSDPQKRITLDRVNIQEIDELTQSIESLSNAVAESSSKLSKIVNMSGGRVGVFEHVKGSNTVFISSALIRLLNLPLREEADSILGSDMFFTHLQSLAEKCMVPGEQNIFHIPTKDNSTLYVRIATLSDNGNDIGMVTDITQEVVHQLQTAYERDFDVLTDLYNIRAFTNKVNALFESPAQLKTACLIMWDLDNLKQFNDTYGHDIGDLYIKEFANHLYPIKAHSAICARRSGDEFLVFLYGYDSDSQIRLLVRDLTRTMSEATFKLPDHTTAKIRASAGIAWYPSDTTAFDQLLRCADFAMYESKRTRKGGILDYATANPNAAALPAMAATWLDKLLDERLVKFAFQPILRVSDTAIYGYEMLMRPQLNVFDGPTELLRVAAAEGKLYLMEALTWFDGMDAFIAHAELKDIPPSARVFINSIGSTWLEPSIAETFIATYQPYLNRIVMELTESEPLNPEYTATKLGYMHTVGALVALDDYGSGYASESTLLTVKPDLIKMDMSIVRDIHLDPSKQLLLDNLIRYAKSEGISVLAEGVETEEEMRVLVAHGVDYLQGYYIGRPSFDSFTVPKDITGAVSDAYQRILGTVE